MFRRVLLWNWKQKLFVARSYIHPNRSLALSRCSTINEQGLGMTKFKIGEMVIKAKGGVGMIRAIFTTMNGERCYAVENEGTVDFVEESKLSAPSRVDLAAT